MSGDSVCEALGPVGTGALIGGRLSRARCAYHVAHNGPCSWEPRLRAVRSPNGKVHAPDDARETACGTEIDWDLWRVVRLDKATAEERCGNCWRRRR